MKHKFLVVLLALLSAFCRAFGLSACGEKKPDETGNNPPVVDPSGNQGSQGTQGGTQKPDDGGQGETPAPHVHSYGEWKVETPATHTQEGKERQYCECGEYNERSIPKTEGHTFGEWKVTKEATCKETGTKERSCACGEKETETLPLVGHDFENMVCKFCGIQASLGLEYTLINEGTEYEVSGLGDCTDTDLVITNNYDGKPVTSIGKYAFWTCSGLTNITIPDSVTLIEMGAFGYCTGLVSVIIGNGVDTIGEGAFGYCNGLLEIKVDKNNQTYHAQDNCLIKTKSKTLILGCQTSVIPNDESVTSIGVGAFIYCEGLTSITIPHNVTSIGEAAFVDCHKLIEVWNFSDLQIEMGSPNNGYVGYYAKHVYNTDTKSKQVKTNDGYLFYEDGAESCLLGYVGKSSEIILPEKSLNGNDYKIYQFAFDGCSWLKEIIIPDSVTVIGDYAFAHCGKLVSVKIGTGVTSIGMGMFLFCEGLREITIPESVTSIKEDAFACCSSLISATIPKDVTTIAHYAFRQCTRLTSVTIGSGVTSIGEQAFYRCDALKEIHFENPNGWKVSRNKDMSDTKAVSGLDDPATAAKYLTDTYNSYSWKREG